MADYLRSPASASGGSWPTNSAGVISASYTTGAKQNVPQNDTGTYNEGTVLCTNCGFSIPSSPAISNIAVNFNYLFNNGTPGPIPPTVYVSCKLIKGGVQVGNTIGTGGDHCTDPNWGTTWTYSDINASNFGVALTVTIYGQGDYYTDNEVEFYNTRITVTLSSGQKFVVSCIG